MKSGPIVDPGNNFKKYLLVHHISLPICYLQIALSYIITMMKYLFQTDKIHKKQKSFIERPVLAILINNF